MAGPPQEPSTWVDFTLEDGVGTIAIRGDLDLRGSRLLRERLQECRRRGPSAIRLEMSGVSFLDSAGVSMLVQARERCRCDGIEFAISAASDAVTRTLRITGIDDVFRTEH